MEKFAQDMDLKLRMTTYCFPPLRRQAGGSCSDFVRLSPERAAELALLDLKSQEGEDGIWKRYVGIDTPIADSCSLEIGEPMQCTAGKSQFWITWDGRMVPCGMLEQPSIPFQKECRPFPEAWNLLRQETAKIRLCPDCLQCPDRSTCLNCAAVTYTETGSFDGKPEYMCQYSKAYRNILTQIASQLSE